MSILITEICSVVLLLQGIVSKLSPSQAYEE